MSIMQCNKNMRLILGKFRLEMLPSEECAVLSLSYILKIILIQSSLYRKGLIIW